jgi:hypothetical protein
MDKDKWILTGTVTAKNGVLEIEAKALASGLHIASLYFDGIQVGTAKVEVIR